MAFLIWLVMLALGSLAGGLLSYIAGRIILPEMGLTAPGFWPWVWVWFFVIIAATLVHLVIEAME